MKRDREQTSSSADNNNGGDKDSETVSKAKPTKAELNASDAKKIRTIVEENKDERVSERALEVSDKDIEDKTPARVTVRIVCV